VVYLWRITAEANMILKNSISVFL